MPTFGGMEPASEYTYVVYDQRTGTIVHVHRIATFRGAESQSPEQDHARALEMARRFGHETARLKSLRVEAFDGRLPQRVDVRAMRLVQVEPAQPRRAAKGGKVVSGPGRRTTRALRSKRPATGGARRAGK
jgi:hypothetical protein